MPFPLWDTHPLSELLSLLLERKDLHFLDLELLLKSLVLSSLEAISIVLLVACARRLCGSLELGHGGLCLARAGQLGNERLRLS